MQKQIAKVLSQALKNLLLCAGLLAIQPSWASRPDFHLHVVPAIVYKVDDPGNSGTSSFVFDIAVICSADCGPRNALTPISASVELSSGGSIVERQMWTTAMLAKVKGLKYRILPETPVAFPTRVLALPEAFDLHFYFRSPQALAIDSANVRLLVADAEGHREEKILRIPINYYQQKTPLIVPFHGLGVIGQDWITNGGHGGGIDTDFAVDVRGLDENYAEQKNDAAENTSASGWGREILAPAAGIVTYARDDVPNNPHPGDPNINSFAALHDPVMAFMGNCIIIDHGNSEYSVMAHMQQGSVTVKVGERVAAGQVIGKLGNSGDSFGPHLHYQLQSDPRLFHGQSLPFRFQSNDDPLSRGRYVNEK